MKKEILFIFGTRPEAIKMAPIINEMKKNSFFNTKVCVTAQHRQMLDQVLEIFSIQPDFDLDLMKPNQSLTELTKNVLKNIERVLTEVNPDMVIVQGDTTTTFISALACFYQKIAIGHVEAGLRTYKKYSPFPEEMNRVLTTKLADIHFAPTEISKQNLLNEGVESASVFVTGNTVIDALFDISKKLRIEPLKRKMILVTGHRRENFGKNFEEIFLALKTIAINNPEIQIVYPVHLNPNVKKPVNEILYNIENIQLIDPVDYLEFVKLMNQSYIIITDSGGVQEEAPSIGKPVLVIRNDTERPEGVKAGTTILVGTEREKIINASQKLLDDTQYYDSISKVANPYGDGKSAKHIVKILNNYFY